MVWTYKRKHWLSALEDKHSVGPKKQLQFLMIRLPQYTRKHRPRLVVLFCSEFRSKTGTERQEKSVYPTRDLPYPMSHGG